MLPEIGRNVTDAQRPSPPPPDDRGPADRSPDSFGMMARQAFEAGFLTLKCAPFDECKAPFEVSGLPPQAETGIERVLAVDAADFERFKAICERERCPFAVVGEATEEAHLTVAVVASDTDRR